MLDRQKLEAILRRRFPDATFPQVAAAANAIMQLAQEEQENERGAARPPAAAASNVEPRSAP